MWQGLKQLGEPNLLDTPGEWTKAQCYPGAQCSFLVSIMLGHISALQISRLIFHNYILKVLSSSLY